MTERLYYTDAECREFDGEVIEVEASGSCVRVRLDRTAFYPTSGGQPFDTGWLGGQRVVEVVDEDDGVWHLLDAAAPRATAMVADEGLESAAPSWSSASFVPSAAVPAAPIVGGVRLRGVIDWPRRFDHMQQHTGQHLLSAAFDRLVQARTVAFHLGADRATIDLARDLSIAHVTAAEQAANQVVWDDRPVRVRFVTAEEARALPLRKESHREGTLRLVEIEDVDLSACGGTHVARTGAVGVIAVTRTERFKGGLRVEFVCGGRALDSHRALRDAVAVVSKKLSAGSEEFATALDRLQADLKSIKKAGAAKERELAGYRAVALAASAVPIPAGRLVASAVDADAEGVKAVASVLGAQNGCVAVIVSSAEPTLVAVACPASSGVAANEILSELIGAFGGRGGGRADLAQAGGVAASPDAVLAKARELLGAR